MKKLALFCCWLSVATWGFAASSTTILYTPIVGPPEGTSNYNWVTDGTANRMWCASFVPGLGITNATQIAVRFGTSAPATATHKAGVAFYDTSGNYLVKGTLTYTETAQRTTQTFTLAYPSGSDFDLAAGTMYYQCFCSNKTGSAGDYVGAWYDTIDDTLDDFINAFTSPRWGYASNACSDGTPNDAMGTLTNATFLRQPILVLGTASP